MRQCLRLKEELNSEFVAAMSTGALNAAGLVGAMPKSHQPGTKPQRMGPRVRLPRTSRTVLIVVAGQILYRAGISVRGFRAVNQ
jgi:hypothetical protein